MTDDDVPTRCPRCGSAEVRPIVYGLLAGPLPPSDRRVPGGCVRTPDSPRWTCAACGLGAPFAPR